MSDTEAGEVCVVFLGFPAVVGFADMGAGGRTFDGEVAVEVADRRVEAGVGAGGEGGEVGESGR